MSHKYIKICVYSSKHTIQGYWKLMDYLLYHFFKVSTSDNHIVIKEFSLVFAYMCYSDNTKENTLCTKRQSGLFCSAENILFHTQKTSSTICFLVPLRILISFFSIKLDCFMNIKW